MLRKQLASLHRGRSEYRSGREEAWQAQGQRVNMPSMPTWPCAADKRQYAGPRLPEGSADPLGNTLSVAQQLAGEFAVRVHEKGGPGVMQGSLDQRAVTARQYES